MSRKSYHRYSCLEVRHRRGAVVRGHKKPRRVRKSPLFPTRHALKRDVSQQLTTKSTQHDGSLLGHQPLAAQPVYRRTTQRYIYGRGQMLRDAKHDTSTINVKNMRNDYLREHVSLSRPAQCFVPMLCFRSVWLFLPQSSLPRSPRVHRWVDTVNLQ